MIESHNPLFEGADPFLMTYQGKYYIYATNSPDGFRVYVSDDLVVWKDKGYCLKKGDVIGQNRFWAPEVIAHKILYGICIGRTSGYCDFRRSVGSVHTNGQEMVDCR